MDQPSHLANPSGVESESTLDQTLPSPVASYRHEVFVSYAYADDQEIKPGDTASCWVGTFTTVVDRLLREALGRPPSIFFDRAHIIGNVPIRSQLADHAAASRTLLVVLSPRYVESKWCLAELEAFGNKPGHTFVLSRAPTPLDQCPLSLRDLSQYKCYTERPLQGDHWTFGVPTLNHYEREYFEVVRALVRDLARKLNPPTTSPIPPLVQLGPSGKIRARNDDPRTHKRTLPPPFGDPRHAAWLQQIYEAEAREMLLDTHPLLASSGNSSSLAESHPSFLAVAGERRLVSEADSSLTTTHRLGLSADAGAFHDALRSRPLSLAVSPAHLGAILILRYLRDIRRYPLNILFRYPHSVEIARHAARNSFPEPVHGISLTLSTAAFLLQNAPDGVFRPHMLMPAMSHGVVARGDLHRNANINGGCFVFMKHPPSSESFLYDDMIRRRIIGRNRVTSDSMEPDHVTASLAAGRDNIKAIIGFPHYHFQQKFNKCVILNDPYASLYRKEVILFIHQDILPDWTFSQAVSSTIRDAWLHLLEDARMRTRIIRALLNDSEYARLISRGAGLHHLRNIHEY